MAEKVEDLSRPEFMARVVAQVYGDAERRRGPAVAGCWCPRSRPDRPSSCTSWLTPIRGGPGGHRGSPARGAKRALQADRRPHRPARTWPATGCGGRPTTTAGLEGPDRVCSRRCRLREAPLRIECYDMSHLQGTDYVGSMVVLRGRPGQEVATTGASG